MTATHQQQSLPGIPVPTPPDEKHPDLEVVLDAYLEDKTESRRLAEKKRLSRAALIAKMQELGYTAYHFVDPLSGKKRQVIATPEVKLSTKGVPRASNPNDLYDDEAEIAAREAGDEPADDGKVESRRVSRASVEDEIDGFAKVRGRMEGGVQ